MRRGVAKVCPIFLSDLGLQGPSSFNTEHWAPEIGQKDRTTSGNAPEKDGTDFGNTPVFELCLNLFCVFFEFPIGSTTPGHGIIHFAMVL